MTDAQKNTLDRTPTAHAIRLGANEQIVIVLPRQMERDEYEAMLNWLFLISPSIIQDWDEPNALLEQVQREGVASILSPTGLRVIGTSECSLCGYPEDRCVCDEQMPRT